MSAASGSNTVTNGLILSLDAANIGITSTVDVLLVAGGGGGGMDMGGGGGAGGVLRTTTTVAHGSSYAVVVGAGGTGAPAAGTSGQPSAHQYTIPATNGGNSTFNGLTAIGGGFGGSSVNGYTPGPNGSSGGSGGGASGYGSGQTGGTGTASQGNRGGNNGGAYYSGGGGGAGGQGTDGASVPHGGPGICYPEMSPYYFGGGGGGASYTLSVGGNGGIGGGGGGAIGPTGITQQGGTGGLLGINAGIPGTAGPNGAWGNVPGGNGGANTGGGGGGGAHYNANNNGGNGGSGIVIIRYAGRPKARGGVISELNGFTTHTFYTNGTFDCGSWSDMSGNGYHANSSTTTYNASNGGAAVFGGTRAVTTLSTFTNSMTWEAWVYCTGDVTTYNMFMGRYLPYFSFHSGNKLYFSNSISGTQRTIQTAATLSLNTWYHATFTTTYDSTNTTMRIYTNGVETASGTWAGSQSHAASNFAIGDGDAVNWYPFTGRVALVRVYNRTLTSTEVIKNFNATRGRFGV